MPIDPDNPTLINLDRGELIKIDKDTDHLWRLKDPADPISGLILEGGGRCFYYQYEHRAWFRNEYHGDLNRVPRLKEKIPATEAEAREREAAREKWEREHGGEGIGPGRMAEAGVTGAPGFPTVPENAGIAGHGGGMSQPGMTASTGYGPWFPQTATHQARFPDANASFGNQSSPAFTSPDHFPSAGMGTEFPGHPERHGRHSPVSLHSPSFPFGPDAPPLQAPSFPPGFPFAPDAPRPHSPSFPPGFPFTADAPRPRSPNFPPSFPFAPGAAPPCPPSPPFPNQSSMPTAPPPMPTAQSSDRHMVITDGNYFNVGGQINNMNRDHPVFLSGHGEAVNWMPDHHSEQRGTYGMNWRY